MLEELVPVTAARILDLGAGRHLIVLLATRRPEATVVGLEVLTTMLGGARAGFDGNPRVRLLARPHPAAGRVEATGSAFAIDHLETARKATLLGEIHGRIASGGIFANLEHASSPWPRLHEQFLTAIGRGPGDEDASNRLCDTETQLGGMPAAGRCQRGRVHVQVARDRPWSAPALDCRGM